MGGEYTPKEFEIINVDIPQEIDETYMEPGITHTGSIPREK